MTTIRPLRPGWPLAALLCLYPLWWCLGIGAFAFVIFAIPMAWDLRRRRPLILLPGFGFWMLFLLWNVLSLTMLPFSATNTTAGSTGGRLISIVVRLLQFAAVTVIALYVVNLPSQQVSLRRIMRWLSMLFLVTVVGGLFGMAAPHFAFTSPLEYVLPHGIDANRYVKTLVHPQFAEVQNVLGYSSPRPAAPWGYTNFWGNNLSILLVWFCLYMWRPATTRRRVTLAVVMAVALVPTVYSLNRGMWLGLVISLAYLIYRLARRGDKRALVATFAVLPVAGVVFLLTPLHGVVSDRTTHSGSAGIRTFLDTAALHGAYQSPVLGWGGPRKANGSSQSIALGPSPKCPNCGQGTIGSTGEFWQIIFSQGFIGIGLYFGFFAAVFWGLRRDRSPTGAAARLLVLLAVFYTYFYNNVPSALALTFISLALSWRTITAPAESRAARSRSGPAFTSPATNLVGATP
jgi:polysaccharide biosynthesis protein PslJ